MPLADWLKMILL